MSAPVNLQSNLTAWTPGYQPVWERGLKRDDTVTVQTGDSVQRRGAQNLKNISDAPAVDRAADAATYTGAIVNIQV